MANIFKSFENFAPSYTGSDDSIVSATAVYESADACQAAAEQLSAMLDDYRTVREAMVASRKGERSAAFEALVGPSLKQYASMEEAKDTRKFWDKVKEFFIRLWHSVQDFFAKFSVFASMTKSKLDKLNIAEIYNAVDKDESKLEVATVKLSSLGADSGAAMWTAPDASADAQKLSEYAKQLKAALKDIRDNNKQDQEVKLTKAIAENTRKNLSAALGAIIKGRDNVVKGFKQAVDEVKGGNGIGEDVNKKLRINALKDARHAQLMAILAKSKLLIKDAKTFIAGVKKVKKAKAA